MIELLKLQKLDMQIVTLKERECELPKQKDKYAIQRERLALEMKNSEDRCKRLLQEQRECTGDIEQRQEKIVKYDGQLYSIKKNEEYKALLYEMDLLKKQISVKEERILALMIEHDESKEALEADKERIQGELSVIDAECAKIDTELDGLTAEREALEKSRQPLAEKVNKGLFSRYERIRKVRTPAVVPLNEDVCGGCFMAVRPQIVNEIMANDKIHACQHCGRLLHFLHRPEVEDS
ncbi:MAG: hypothetical protein KAH38_01100 [Candidatus Hydrogenedentes bacterium]|nr:hypothetical protein [Candidatus Hydrogenedentota bacterium]